MSLREYQPLKREVIRKEYRVSYYIFCEGENTEWTYFTGLRKYCKEVGIHSSVKIIPFQKSAEQRTWSNPKKLFELVAAKREDIKANENSTYDEKDVFVLVFDLDIYNLRPKIYRDFCENLQTDEQMAVTNPCFELWLLLHEPGAYKNHIFNDIYNILENKKVSNKHTYTSKKVSDILKFNTKNNFDFKEHILERINIAIEQEKMLCQDSCAMIGQIGCNIGVLITKMKERHFE